MSKATEHPDVLLLKAARSGEVSVAAVALADGAEVDSLDTEARGR